MIAITAATGKSGRKAAVLLLTANIPVRVIGSLPEESRRLGEMGAELVHGNEADTDFLAKAFVGAEGVYMSMDDHSSYSVPAYLNRLIFDSTIAAIHEAKVQKVVCLSCIVPRPKSGTTGLRNANHEPFLSQSVDVVLLKAGYILEELFTYKAMFTARRFHQPENELGLPIPMISSQEIGNKVAELLKTPTFEGQSIVNLCGQKWVFYAQSWPEMRKNTAHISTGNFKGRLPIVEGIAFQNYDIEYA
jgi:hypothetical protein